MVITTTITNNKKFFIYLFTYIIFTSFVFLICIYYIFLYMYYDLIALIPIEIRNAGKVITIAVGIASVIIISENIDISDSDI